MKENIDPSKELIGSELKDIDEDMAEADQAAAHNQTIPNYEYDSRGALMVHNLIESAPKEYTFEKLIGMIALGTNDFKGQKKQELVEFFGEDMQITVEDAQKLFIEIRRKQSIKH